MDFESQFWAIINTPNYSNPRTRKYIDDELTLQDALLCGSLDEIEEILRESYDLTLSAQNDWELRCRQIVDVCLEQQINVYMLDSALLHFVIDNLYEDFESVLLRSKDFDINTLNYPLKRSLLHFAIEKGRKNVVKVLLAFGADVNVKASYSQTPLLYAAYSAQNEIAEMLLKAGANVNAKDDSGATPINAAIRRNVNDVSFNYGKKLYHSDLIKLLCEYGADLNFQNYNGTLTLLTVCRKGAFKEVQFLIEHGADLLSTDRYGQTAIYCGVRGYNYDIIDFLLRSGVDVNAKNNDDATAIHQLAKTLKFHYTLKNLRYNDPEVISAIWDSDYEAKLLKKSADMIEFLVDNGANVNTFNNEVLTPLMESVRLNSLEIVSCLLELKALVVKNQRYRSYYFINNVVIESNPDLNLNADFYTDRVNTWKLLTAFLATKECDISGYDDGNSTDFKWVLPFFELCKTEVNRMKKRTICKNRSVTFFDFLTKDIMDVLLFCRNEEVMTVLESGKHKEEFRSYKYLFERRMERVEKLQNCETSFRRFLIDKFFKKVLPLAVVDKIISYLTAGNVRNFGRALGISKDFPDGNLHYTK